MGQKLDELPQLISDIHSYGINYHTRELWLHGRHTDNDVEPGVDYRMATAFIKNLRVLEQSSRQNVLVHMHTIGGEWGDGMAIYDSIRLAKSSVTIVGYAQATSMSGVILQAGDKRILMPDCDVMIHHGSIELNDNTLAVKSNADWNERLSRRMLQIFAQRAINGEFFKERGYSFKQVISYIDKKVKDKGDWYMSAEEAVFYGLADGVLGEKGAETLQKCRSSRKVRFRKNDEEKQ